eukprot:955811_1
MPSAARDRTQEFLATVHTFQQFNTIETLHTPIINNTSQTHINESHHIHQLTLKIDAAINDVSQTKLKQIEQLAKVTNNWKDYQSEINQLIINVNEDLHHIDQNIEYLTIIIPKLNYNNYHYASHQKALLNQLINKNKILKKLYRSTYDIVIESLRKQKKHRNTYGIPKQLLSRPRKTLAQYREERHEREILKHEIEDDNQNDPMQIQRKMQLYDTQMNFVNHQELQLEKVRDIESQMIEINGMMSDVIEMVHYQGNMIQVIQENVIKANENMNGVINELQKYLAKMT